MADSKTIDDEWLEAGSATGETWNKEGTLVGVYKSKQTDVGPNNSNMYKIQEDGKEELTGVWGSTVLDGRFNEIPLGSTVKIECLGKVKGKRAEYTDFKVLYKLPPTGWADDAKAEVDDTESAPTEETAKAAKA